MFRAVSKIKNVKADETQYNLGRIARLNGSDRLWETLQKKYTSPITRRPGFKPH